MIIGAAGPEGFSPFIFYERKKDIKQIHFNFYRVKSMKSNDKLGELMSQK